MRTIRRAELHEYGEPYVVQQAIPNRLRDLLVDRAVFVGQQPVRWWRRRTGWSDLAYFLALIALLFIAINVAGGRISI